MTQHKTAGKMPALRLHGCRVWGSRRYEPRENPAGLPASPTKTRTAIFQQLEQAAFFDVEVLVDERGCEDIRHQLEREDAALPQAAKEHFAAM